MAFKLVFHYVSRMHADYGYGGEHTHSFTRLSYLCFDRSPLALKPEQIASHVGYPAGIQVYKST